MSSDPLSFDDFQHGARQTAQPYLAACEEMPIHMKAEKLAECLQLSYASMGLASEAGEVAGKVKKVLRDHRGHLTLPVRQTLKKELGDVLWYVAECASLLGFTMTEVAEANALKLKDRMERKALQGSGDER